ncbi:MAG TPA: hypothetical protein ENN72_06960 [Firmicutes bacterium]|nr:hypothetical protein [Bacillota bacterium]
MRKKGVYAIIAFLLVLPGCGKDSDVSFTGATVACPFSWDSWKSLEMDSYFEITLLSGNFSVIEYSYQ